MIKNLASFYKPKYPNTLAYMLQSTEYHAGPYLKWYWRTRSFDTVARRRNLDKTQVAKILYGILVLGMVVQILAGILLVWLGATGRLSGGQELGAATIIAYPIVWAHLIVIPNELGRWLVIKPKSKKQRAFTKEVFAKHKATVIAVAGSYGKTTMKEILKTVLSEGKKVAATTANKNVASEHAKLARSLSGDEDVIIVEYGEEKPGDIANFAVATKPDIGVITGLAPAHLDKYKTLEAAARDIFSLDQFVRRGSLYVNGDNDLGRPYLKDEYVLFGSNGVGNWTVSDVAIGMDGMSFTLKNNDTTYKLDSWLIGRHLIGDLVATVAIAHNLGLTKDQIVKGVAKTKPYEHRMEPRELAGAWLLDDTYNGTIEGMKAGLELLKELKGKRKIYVTPGLVDQGKETASVHQQLGQYIAEAKPDVVVLMRNSATESIRQGLNSAGFKGTVNIQDDPAEFYTNLDKFVASGDVVMMQNDWTDNYN